MANLLGTQNHFGDKQCQVVCKVLSDLLHFYLLQGQGKKTELS